MNTKAIYFYADPNETFRVLRQARNRASAQLRTSALPRRTVRIVVSAIVQAAMRNMFPSQVMKRATVRATGAAVMRKMLTSQVNQDSKLAPAKFLCWLVLDFRLKC